jgi:cytochrome c5
MKLLKPLASTLLLAAMATSFTAQAADAKRGRVYFRMVCTVCHMEKSGGPISPSSRKKADWASYFQADKHAKGKDTVKQYFSKEYRASIKAKNQAAAKYAEVPDAELMDDVKTFLSAGALDSDTPTSCD